MAAADVHASLASAAVRRVLWTLLVANLLVVAAKAIAGWQANSLAVLSDAVHSLTDAANNLIGVWLIRAAAKPPDREHPYGHAKLEPIGAFVVAALMGLMAYEIGREAALRLWSGVVTPVTLTPLTFAIMLGTLAINLAVVWYERCAGRRLGSTFLLADAQHTLSDVYVTLGVLVGLVGIGVGWAWLDPVAALVVVAAVGWGAYHVLVTAINELMDAAAVDSADLIALARQHPDVVDVRYVRSRGRGAHGFAELTLVFRHNDLRRAHATSDLLEEQIRQAHGITHITIHLEPAEPAAADAVTS
ncbi:MAG: cation diffusion facilitator family transporter [Chloracidobacterium sp.]|uniref:Cation transporter n=1 Tax=Chloracidobacterium validum TaxID=2821543 RepID=A0ABX8B5T9_9BACT|nr:cation diffusion facilitator family transporter [Chloracidobacterium validum]QUW02332.1 cation transporter [Chloracidobacterium validum]